MACKFQIKPKQHIELIFNRALHDISNYDAKYNGDSGGGDFTLEIFGSKFKGIIDVDNNIITVEITDKPFWIPCAIIESTAKSYIADI